MTDPPSAQPPGNPSDDDDDWDDDDWDDPEDRRILGMTPRTAMWAVVAVGVVVAIVWIAVIAISNSSKNPDAAPGTAVTGPRPTSTLSPSSVPPGEVSCAVITADPNLAGVYTFTPAAVDPPQAPMPPLRPARQCTGSPDKGNSGDIVALIWPNFDRDAYEQVLIGADWTYDEAKGEVTFYRNADSPYTIALLQVDGALVALYSTDSTG